MKKKARRPLCRQCGKPLAADYVHEYETYKKNGETYTRHVKTNRIRGYGYSARGHFCSLRCGWRFAINVVENTPERIA